MKLLVRVSVVALVCAGAFASTFTPKTYTAPAVSSNSLVAPSAMPIPSCDPRDGCTL